MSPKSIIQLTENLKSLYIKTAPKLKGSDRRQFMAEVVKGLGIGGQTLVEQELRWNRLTIHFFSHWLLLSYILGQVGISSPTSNLARLGNASP